MMRHRTGYMILFFALAVTITACKKPYDPPAISAPGTYLVVEGVINSGADSTIIKLNHTVKLSASTSVNPELDAIVSVEGDDNSSRPLATTGKGIYFFPGLNLDVNHKYRLKIKTADNKEYASDFIPVINSPAIDSVTYKVKSDGIDINLNTHSSNNLRYYRWEYNETWVHESDFESNYKSNGDTVLQRDRVNDGIYVCWRNNASSTITLGSSAKLAQDVISDFPITFISRHDDKLRHRYSILVRQYALTKEAYDFWLNLKKNTEQLGSIFDAQPSQINGNIHSLTDSNEPVIGYISAGNYATKRIYIDESTLPPWLDPLGDGCVAKPFLYRFFDKDGQGPFNQVDQYINFYKATGELQIPIDAVKLPGSPILGYTGAPPSCVDCTLTGSNKKPDFWQSY
ncbi:DUF4249 domain-containing protein [Mucilaginibacter sp.]|uniref:DUF4249 domain-containing protein n=1 Tax=Mucilaginibacter sp. TaxID=1882438 RepID=UPI0025DFC1A0|nr:DUF4249 domain-containing protein [Mucilaginibacter sp.]